MSPPRQSISDPAAPSTGNSQWYAWAAVVLLLSVIGPLFVCMPLTADTALYDLQARCVISGGVLYRDIVEPNFPGVVWIHVAIRSVLGWSTEAMRVADLLIVTAILLMLSRLTDSLRKSTQPASDSTASIAPYLLLTGFLFYMSLSEWCHCQRDTWMLLPALLAISLRLSKDACHRPLKGFVEGICWGIAFWIKPQIAVPATAVLFVDGLMAASLRIWFRHTTAVIAGGLAAGLPGVIWMTASDTWPWFSQMAFDWNVEYLASSQQKKDLHRVLQIYARMQPWWLVHIFAIPLALQAVWQVARRVFLRQGVADSARSFCILCTCYLAWLFQAIAIQHSLDYIHVPPVLLGLAVIFVRLASVPVAVCRVAFVLMLILGIGASPLTSPPRAGVWGECVTQGSTPRVQAALSRMGYPDRQAAAQVADFLRQQHVTDGQVTCLNGHSVHILHELQIQPSCRYWCLWILQGLFPSHSDEIKDSILTSTHRYVVTEETACRALGLDMDTQQFPWNLPLVYQSGTYRVYEVPRPQTPPDRVAAAN
jgi:hypothetical protein